MKSLVTQELPVIPETLPTQEERVSPVDTGLVDSDGDGWSSEDGDCDDTDPLINPNAEEVCEDGIDQNCDGSDDVCEDLGLCGGEEACIEDLNTDGIDESLCMDSTLFQEGDWQTNNAYVVGNGIFNSIPGNESGEIISASDGYHCLTFDDHTAGSSELTFISSLHVDGISTIDSVDSSGWVWIQNYLVCTSGLYDNLCAHQLATEDLDGDGDIDSDDDDLSTNYLLGITWDGVALTANGDGT